MTTSTKVRILFTSSEMAMLSCIISALNAGKVITTRLVGPLSSACRLLQAQIDRGCILTLLHLGTTREAG